MKKYGLLPNGKKNLKPKFIKLKIENCSYCGKEFKKTYNNKNFCSYNCIVSFGLIIHTKHERVSGSDNNG